MWSRDVCFQKEKSTATICKLDKKKWCFCFSLSSLRLTHNSMRTVKSISCNRIMIDLIPFDGDYRVLFYQFIDPICPFTSISLEQPFNVFFLLPFGAYLKLCVYVLILRMTKLLSKFIVWNFFSYLSLSLMFLSMKHDKNVSSHPLTILSISHIQIIWYINRRFTFSAISSIVLSNGSPENLMHYPKTVHLEPSHNTNTHVCVCSLFCFINFFSYSLSIQTASGYQKLYTN